MHLLKYGRSNFKLCRYIPYVHVLENSVDQDQLATGEAILSGSAMFSMQRQNPLYWETKVIVSCLIIQHDKGLT